MALAALAAPALAAPYHWRSHRGAVANAAGSYAIRQGDTYWALARRFGTTVSALEAANPGDPAWDLYPGLVIRLPGGAAGSSGAPGASAQGSGGASGGSQGSGSGTSGSGTSGAGGSGNRAGVAATASNIDLLARIAAAEEGNRPLLDQIGVDAVVLNRVASGQFPNSVRGVIFQAGQFTSVSNGYYYRAAVGATSIQAAKDALAGDDPTGGALYFYDPGQGISSSWIYTRRVITTIDGTVYAA